MNSNQLAARIRMTADLVTNPDTAAELSPEHVSPFLVRLADKERQEVTGRVFEISGHRRAVVGWRCREVAEAPRATRALNEAGKCATRLLAEATSPPGIGGDL